MASDSITASGTDLHALLGLSPASPRLTAFLSTIQPASPHLPPPEVKAYSDIVYLNHRHIGVSLSFAPVPGYRLSRTSTVDDIENARREGKLACIGIDVYNHNEAAKLREDRAGKTPRQRVEDRWEPFPAYPILLPAASPAPPLAPTRTSTENAIPSSNSAPAAGSPEATPYALTPSTTGAALLSHLGEPTRKGGGSSSTPALGIWTEWTSLGIMVEWASSGLGAWDKGGESTWRCLSVFEPGKASPAQ